MKKILLVPISLFLMQSNVGASVQEYFLNGPVSSASLSFSLNNNSESINPTVLTSIVSGLNSGDELVFTANVSVDPYGNMNSWGPVESQSSYSLLVGSPAWGNTQYTVVSGTLSASSCSLNITGLNPIGMPLYNGETVSIKIATKPLVNPSNFTVHLVAENLKNIQGFYVVDGSGNKYDVTKAIQELGQQPQYGGVSKATLAYYSTGNSAGQEVNWGFNVDLVFKNNARLVLPLFQTENIGTSQMGMPLSIYINGIRVVVLTTHMGWSYCRFTV